MSTLAIGQGWFLYASQKSQLLPPAYKQNKSKTPAKLIIKKVS